MNSPVKLVRRLGMLWAPLLALASLLMSACAGGALDYDGLRESEVEEELVALDGDIVMRKSQLPHGLGVVEKGFRSDTKIDKNRLKAIALNIAFDVDPGWEAAFLHAAREWTSTGVVNISEGNTGDVISVVNTSLISAIADAGVPSNGRAGDRIRINVGFRRTARQKRQTAMHEIGHTLGLMHPGEGTPIQGTSSSLNQVSVMRTAASGMGTVPQDRLTEEDRKSLANLYQPPKMCSWLRQCSRSASPTSSLVEGRRCTAQNVGEEFTARLPRNGECKNICIAQTMRSGTLPPQFDPC